MDPQRQPSALRSPLIAGAIVFFALFSVTGAVVARVGSERIAEECVRDQAALVAEHARHEVLHDAARAAAEVRALLDDARRTADVVAAEVARDAAWTETAGTERAAELRPLAGTQHAWTEDAARGTFLVARNPADAQSVRDLAAWSRRIAPLLRAPLRPGSATVRVTVTVDGQGLVGAPAGWPAGAESDARIAEAVEDEIALSGGAEAGSWVEAGPRRLVYSAPAVRADGHRVGTAWVEVSAAAVSEALDAVVPSLDAFVLISAAGAPVLAQPELLLRLGLAEDAGPDDVAGAIRPALGDEGSFYPDWGGSSTRIGGRDFAAMRVEGAPFSVGLLRDVPSPVAVAPASARAVRRFGTAVVALSVVFGAVLLAGAAGLARTHAARLRAARAGVEAAAGGAADGGAETAGDDDVAAIWRGANALSIRLRRAQARAEESDRRAAELVDAIGDGIVTTDEGGRIVHVNQRFADLLRRDAGSLAGQPVEQYLLPESIQRWRACHARLRQGGSARLEASWLAAGPPHPQTTLSCVALHDESGAFAGCWVVVTDVTDRVRAQTEIGRAEKVRALGEMAGGVAHDFNNVLTVILGNTQFLLLEDLPDDVKEALRAVERAALDGTETVRRIREFAKSRAVVLGPRPVAPDDVVRRALADARRRVERSAPSVGEIRVVAERCSRRTVRGNAEELVEAVSNVLANALDAMPRGGTLTVDVFDRGEDQVAIRVEDTGTGMTPEQVQKVFDPFFTTKVGGRCSGLGLSIAFGIVRAHRGRIDVRSEPGKGSAFTIVLPAASEPLAAAPAASAPATDVVPRALLVGSAGSCVGPLADELRRLGVQAATVTGPAAHALVGDRGIFNVLVAENELGGTGGWDVARQARSVRDDLRIVLLVSPADRVSDSQARNAGIDCVLEHPVGVRDLHAAIFALLATPRERQETGPRAAGPPSEPVVGVTSGDAVCVRTVQIWGRGRPAPDGAAPVDLWDAVATQAGGPDAPTWMTED